MWGMTHNDLFWGLAGIERTKMGVFQNEVVQNEVVQNGAVQNEGSKSLESQESRVRNPDIPRYHQIP
jgi:hypothetical protein